jgi:hypothetical protein
MNQPAIVIVPAFFFMVGYIVWVVTAAIQRKQRVKLITEFHSRLLDRLGSVKDFNDFVHTEAGSRFVQELASEAPAPSAPQERILRAAQFGSVLVCLGFGLLLLTFFSPITIQAGRAGFNALGTIALSLGIGFIISAVASYRLAGMLGLLSRRSDMPPDALTSRP